MAAPAIQTADTQFGAQNSDSTTWTLTYPTNVAAGDLILAVYASDGNTAPTWPAGFESNAQSGLTGATLGVAKKKATGAESGNFTLTLDASEQGAWRVFRITDWVGELGTAFSTAASSGSAVASVQTSVNGNPPSLDPPWGAEDTLWIAGAIDTAAQDIATYPLADTQSYDKGTGGGSSAGVGLCSTSNSSTSLDPSAFTTAGGTLTHAFTVAIRGFSGFPIFTQAAAGATDASGAWSYTGPAPLAANRILIVQFLQDGTSASPPTISSTTNIKDLAGTAGAWTSIGQFAVGNPTAAYQWLYIGYSTGTSAPVITGANAGGDDVYVRMYEFASTFPGTTLATVIENSTAGSSANGVGLSNTAADTGVTTLGRNRLALNFVAVNDDNAISAFTGETGGDWTLATTSFAESSGTDGAIALQAATITTAGTINGGTGSIVDSDSWGVVGFALIGTTAEFVPQIQFLMDGA